MTSIVLGLITPFLMAGGFTDPALIQQAAIATIAAYTTSPHHTAPDRLIGIAQAVAFALTSVDNLRLSLPADLSLSMKLKLRGNANALNRSAQKATAALDAQPRPTTTPAPEPKPEPKPEPEPDRTDVLAALETAKAQVRQAQKAAERQSREAAPSAASKQTASKQTPADRQIDLSWASAMTDVAAEYSAELADLPPAQRRTHLARIGALSRIATMLGSGEAPPLKARLLGTTTLHG